jgi:hypothetical protein
MIFCGLTPDFPLSAAQVGARTAEQGVKVGVVGTRRFRIVLHYWIDDQAVEKTVQAFKPPWRRVCCRMID